MNERSILEQICQASSEEIGNLMRGFMRECVIEERRRRKMNEILNRFEFFFTAFSSRRGLLKKRFYKGTRFHLFMLARTGHHILMELKTGKLVYDFRKSRERSAIIEVTL